MSYRGLWTVFLVWEEEEMQKKREVDSTGEKWYE